MGIVSFQNEYIIFLIVLDIVRKILNSCKMQTFTVHESELVRWENRYCEISVRRIDLQYFSTHSRRTCRVTKQERIIQIEQLVGQVRWLHKQWACCQCVERQRAELQRDEPNMRVRAMWDNTLIATIPVSLQLARLDRPLSTKTTIAP